MAFFLRLPAGSLLTATRPGFHPSCAPKTAAAKSYPCRHFSQTPIAPRAMRGMPQTLAPKQPAQPSMKTRGLEMSKSEMPQDMGLLPGTFVRPLWRDMPSIFQQPRERLQLEWLWIKLGFQNILGVLAYAKWLNKLPLRLRERRQVAHEFHRRMYTAFAEGDMATIRKICCTGLANNLSARISTRPKDEKVTWSLDSYIRTPATLFTGVRVLADRATQIPEIPNSGIRQVVLRITSRQSTGKTKLPSTTIPGSGAQPQNNAMETAPAKQQDCTEYIVLQKLMWFGEEQDWRIWGHATPTTVEDLEDPFFAPGLKLSDRLEAMKEMMEGRK